MRITRIDIEGEQPGNFAILQRKRGSEFIEIELLTPEHPNGKKVCVARDDLGTDEFWETARWLQHEMDGYV